MDQGEVMDQFHSSGGGDGWAVVAAYRFADQEAKKGSNPLPSLRLGRFEVLINPAQMVSQHAVEGGQGGLLFSQEGFYLFLYGGQV
jgi:hypothetical protein